MLSKINQLFSLLWTLLVTGLLGGSLSTLGLIRRPRKAVAYIQYQLFGWRMIAGSGLPQRSFHELFDTPERLTVDLLPKEGLYFDNWDANYAKDMLYLILLAHVLAPNKVFEIGTLHGYTALLFARNTAADTTVYTLDLPLEGTVTPTLNTTIVDDLHIGSHTSTKKYIYHTQEGGEKVQQLLGDSAQFDYSPYHKKVGLFFIDGAHSYEYVRSDTEKALDCMAEGGVIVWHDYGRWGVNGVTRYLHELRRSGKDIYRLPGSSLAVLRC